MFSCLLVASRLALPLPLTAVVARSTRPGVSGIGGFVPLAAGFVGLALVAGLAEHFQRLAFAHFAGRTVSDARAAALARLGHGEGDAPGERASQVISDSARVKQGLKGLLNHIVLNGLLLLGACVALALADPELGMIQFFGVGVVVLVAIASAGRVAAVAADHRSGEATLSGVIQGVMSPGQAPGRTAALAELGRHDATSGEADVAMTRWEARATCLVIVILTVTAAVILALGVHAVDAGQMSSGTLFTVVAYLLVLQGPGVRFARQITRIGPLLVSATELGLVLVDDVPRQQQTDV
jgi:ABC-type multidrug transport system fused ATPase/permease subunit